MRSLKFIIISLTALMLGGCLSPVSLPTKHRFTLNPKQVHSKHYSTHNVTLLVLSTQASDAIAGQKMAYVKKPYQLAYFSQNIWISPPAEQINDLIVNSLRKTGYFKAVASTPFIGTTNYKLATHLSQLQQNFLLKPSHEQLQLSAQIINASNGKIVAEKTFCYSVPTPKNNPYGGVVAANRALAKLLPAITRFVVHSIY